MKIWWGDVMGPDATIMGHDVLGDLVVADLDGVRTLQRARFVKDVTFCPTTPNRGDARPLSAGGAT